MFSASRVSFCGALATFLMAGGLLLTVDAAQPPPSPPPARASGHSAFVGRYCVSCHNDRLKRGGLTLDAAVATDIGGSPEIWEKVLRKVRARQMPPIGLPRPDEATYNTEIATLETALDRAAASAPNPGRTATLRRLTRTEYQNAIRDLLALDVDVTALLPADESSYGFDNVTVGDLSPTLLDRYIAAAEKISRVAVGRPSVSPDGDTIRIPADLTQEEHIEGLPIGTRGGALI
jgi:mono/diheme cytochrome c family protein